ncbi:g7533 [Coccomyxa viridis]|uniref:G7533 protein n=1 Tax=Coccomyxa viridis TaxID=1274662 RepID=A0ABP1G255_9CHLO
MHDTVEIHSADGKRVLAEVKKQLVSLTHGAKVTVTGMQFPLEVKGDFRGKNFQIKHGNNVIARVTRKSLMKDIKRFFSGNDHYTLTVAPHVDSAFMVALAVVFDTMFHHD